MITVYDVIRRPLVTEKGVTKKDSERTLCFEVNVDANKTQIKIAVEEVFGVKVLAVNTANRQGKQVRTRIGFGRRNNTKRAIVSVAAGDKIELFSGNAG